MRSNYTTKSRGVKSKLLTPHFFHVHIFLEKLTINNDTGFCYVTRYCVVSFAKIGLYNKYEIQEHNG
jgi:hypothetical protein